jgi:hypothetical protein
MGKRPGSGIVFMAAFLAAGAAVAQEKPLQTATGNTDTVKVAVSGRMDLDYVNRSSELTAYTRSESNPTGLGAAATSASENTFEGYMAVRFDVQVGSVTAIVELGTRRIDDNVIEYWGDSPAPSIQLRAAQAVVPDFLVSGLSVHLGISTWTYDIRGRGSSFAFDPGHSSTFTRNIASVGPATEQEQGDARLVEAGFPNELLPVGAVLTWKNDVAQVDLVILPAVLEGGGASQDEGLYAVDFLYKLDDRGSRIGGILSVSSFTDPNAPDQGQNSALITGGVSLCLRDLLMKGLEVYGEAYVQFGDAGEDIAQQAIEAAGRAFQVGVEYNHVVGNPMPVWIGVNFTSYSGDSDPAGSGDDKVDRFASYESVNDLLIIESMYYGYDIDSNYTVIKINAGLKLATIRENDLQLDVIVGLAKQTEESNLAGGVDEIGNEVDLKANWEITKQFSIRGAVGMLFGSDLVEESLRAGGAAEPEDSALLWYLGFDIRF